MYVFMFYLHVYKNLTSFLQATVTLWVAHWTTNLIAYDFRADKNRYWYIRIGTFSYETL